MKLWISLLGVAGVLCVLTCAHAAFGQNGPGPGQGGSGGPGGPGGQLPPPPQQATLKIADGAVFTLQHGTLYKFDGATLKQLGSVDLSGQTTTTTTTHARGQHHPPAPGEFLITKDTPAVIVAVVGDTFYRIDAATLKIAAKGALPAVKSPQGAPDAQAVPGEPGGPDAMGGPGGPDGPDAMGGPGGPGGPGGQGMMGGPGGGPGMGPMHGPPPALPVLELNGNTLYVLRGNQLCAVNITDGTVTAQATTSAAPAAAPAK